MWQKNQEGRKKEWCDGMVDAPSLVDPPDESSEYSCSVVYSINMGYMVR
ncbi:MAG: hypothetical protein ACXACC_11015 [Promethearchaeota archaeon]